MGEKSDSKKVSSPYVVLENRPLDQWKVTELKEELKKRKLMTKGLKEELVKRLDEAVRTEMDEASRNLENDLNNEAVPEGQSDDAENTTDVTDDTRDKNESLGEDNTDVEMGMGMVHADDGLQSLAEKSVTESEGSVVTTRVETVKVVEEVTVETTVVASEGAQLAGNQTTAEGPNQEPVNGEPKPESQSPEEEHANQVDEVSKVQSDSISIDTISNSEKNDLKDNVIADDVKLEIDAKPEMVIDDSKSESVEIADVKKAENTDLSNKNDNVIANDIKLVGVDEPHEEKVTNEEIYVNNDENVDIKKNDSGDAGSSEKLNLDRSSGDDSMEEDALDSKQIDSKFGSDEVDKREKIEVKVDDSADVMVEDVPAQDKTGPSVISTKRKPHDQEAAESSEIIKRQRRWNSEGVKVSEQQSTNHSPSTTPKDAFQTSAKRPFSRSESTLSQESPKERVVPPSTKTPTTSLRIDNFVRPFTLKAVQELLGKTGKVVSFWMDQIKTHCYVTYESVEEAIETRNAVCNLQWPVYGGKLLMADFVDPQEVKNRVDPPPPTPVTVQPTTTQAPQPSPRVKQQQLPPPPSLPPPPPLANVPPPARNRAPVTEKIEPPIVTLDDLFRKTRATPRIYYLPLSDEQVAAKLNAEGKAVK
ncbi:SAP domain-containing protein [Artemisia annua]|uniref:SAP domain-containing protein n=1 Tax=Artemisia annua TaxID=35608 RepID=A0A2U1NLQ7_ARTAN|nr:SAP domain-containing protein [Artemisia annua]